MSAAARQQPQPQEPRMDVRDADLRSLVYEHGAVPGSDLRAALRELQERRDHEAEEWEE